MTEQLGFDFVVDDKASAPLGAIEKAYQGLLAKMQEFGTELSKSMKTSSDRTTEAVDKTDKHEKKSTSLWKTLKEKTSPALRGTNDALGEMRGEFQSTTGSILDTGGAFSTLSKIVGIAGFTGILVGVIGFLGMAFAKAVQFQREVAELNEAFTTSGKQAREISSAYFSLSHSYGFTASQAQELVKALLQLGQTPKAARDAGTSFKELVKITGQLSAATGLSGSTAAKLTDQLLRINKVNPSTLRGIAFSIKNIADNARIGADELVGLNESLAPVFAHLTSLNPNEKSALTKEFLAIGGALSDVGISGEKAMANFGDMLDETSIEGSQKLAQLSHFTGLLGEDIKGMIKSNPAAIFDAVARKSEFLRKNDPMGFKVAARDLQPLNMGFEELTRLAEGYATEGKKSFGERVKELSIVETKTNNLAAAAGKRQSSVDAAMNRLRAIWDRLLNKIGGKIIEKMFIPLSEKVIPYFEKFANWLAGLDWDAIFDGFIKALNFVITTIVVVKNIIASILDVAIYVFKAIDSVLDVFAASIKLVFKSVATIIEGVINIIMGAWTGGFEGMRKAAVKLFQDLVSNADEWLDSIFSFFDSMISNVMGMFSKIAGRIPGISDATVKAMKEMAEAADTRIQKREEKAEKREVEETIRSNRIIKEEGEHQAIVDQIGRSRMYSSNIPSASQMITNQYNAAHPKAGPDRLTMDSPTMESLLQQQNEISTKMLNKMDSKGGSRAGKIKSSSVDALNGG